MENVLKRKKKCFETHQNRSYALKQSKIQNIRQGLSLWC